MLTVLSSIRQSLDFDDHAVLHLLRGLVGEGQRRIFRKETWSLVKQQERYALTKLKVLPLPAEAPMTRKPVGIVPSLSVATMRSSSSLPPHSPSPLHTPWRTIAT